MINESELAACIRRSIARYIKDLDGEAPSGIYDMVLKCVEKPVIEAVLEHAEGNQTHAAEFLGMNRNTLRKKMKAHGLKP